MLREDTEAIFQEIIDELDKRIAAYWRQYNDEEMQKKTVGYQLGLNMKDYSLGLADAMAEAKQIVKAKFDAPIVKESVEIKEYRKKPVVVKAFLLTKEMLDKHKGAVQYINGRWIRYYEDYAIIDTLEGEMKANAGDYIVIGVRGEIYPCKGDIFEETYELVGEE